MPNIYRQRTQSFSDTESEPENIAPAAPTDADDSIVLSDLVRTGEASRLRRRGALRLDHGHTSQATRQRSLSPSIIVVGSPSWDSESEDPQLGQGSMRERVSRYTRTRSQRSRRAGEGETRYSLFCGADLSEPEEDLDERPYVPSLLPAYPASSSTLSSPAHSFRRKKRTNGCGALLHMNATPRLRQGAWSAKGEASGAVVDLEPYYFDKESVAKIVRSACGCVREGVGCAVW